MSNHVLTTASGVPVEDNQNSLTAGRHGPVLLQDFHLIEKLQHFDRERVPERVVHAKGTGAYGSFTVTHDVTKLSAAKLFDTVGKKTDVFLRLSSVAGERGSADSARDSRGFAVRFYTADGNWDLVGGNHSMFFINDAIKFPDLVHTHKRDPQTNLKSPTMEWDFYARSPETLHMLTMTYSPRGLPDGHRHMDGFGIHTFSLVNAAGERHWCKWHLKTMQGIKNLSDADAARIAGEDPDYCLIYTSMNTAAPLEAVCAVFMLERKSAHAHNRTP
jgi:catalase